MLTLPNSAKNMVLLPNLIVGALVSTYAVVEIKNTVDFCIAPETSVNDIHRRVRYMKWVQEKLDVDHITLLDVDMGAHVYYRGWDIVDIAGLVDVPMGQHQDFNRSFIKQYLFEERMPDFALNGLQRGCLEAEAGFLGGDGEPLGRHTFNDLGLLS